MSPQSFNFDSQYKGDLLPFHQEVEVLVFGNDLRDLFATLKQTSVTLPNHSAMVISQRDWQVTCQLPSSSTASPGPSDDSLSFCAWTSLDASGISASWSGLGTGKHGTFPRDLTNRNGWFTDLTMNNHEKYGKPPQKIGMFIILLGIANSFWMNRNWFPNPKKIGSGSKTPKTYRDVVSLKQLPPKPKIILPKEKTLVSWFNANFHFFFWSMSNSSVYFMRKFWSNHGSVFGHSNFSIFFMVNSSNSTSFKNASN